MLTDKDSLDTCELPYSIAEDLKALGLVLIHIHVRGNVGGPIRIWLAQPPGSLLALMAQNRHD